MVSLKKKVLMLLEIGITATAIGHALGYTSGHVVKWAKGLVTGSPELEQKVEFYLIDLQEKFLKL